MGENDNFRITLTLTLMHQERADPNRPLLYARIASTRHTLWAGQRYNGAGSGEQVWFKGGYDII